MGLNDLFPQPKRVDLRDGQLSVADLRIELAAAGDEPLIRNAAAQLANAAPGARTYRIEVRTGAAGPDWPQGANRDEAYTLELGSAGGTIEAATPAGVFLAAQTLGQLLSGDSLPLVRISDWPDLRYRGLYIESKWGPDLMSLDDWKAAIDAIAAMKFNSVGIGVYGCWIVQYGGKRTEFMMLPFPDHPGLTTPKTLRYFSPKADAWETLNYLPTMVTDDLFGEIVAYAKAHNVIVRPHFNSPGHNTVIPQAYPETASLDDNGEPIGYGFCLSNPKTYELIFALYDSVIERYLRPNGIDWFHIGLDEVDAYLGIDERDPTRSVDPWCRCPDCRDKPHGRQLQEYAVRVCAHLKEQGITQITMWNDALDHLGALDEEFAAMIDAAGLREHVVVQWWRYQEPVLIPRAELGLRAWSTPMAGYWTNLFTQSYLSNIYTMLYHGGRAGIEGADAYCIYDPAYDRNYACLAEFSWNQPGDDDLELFKSRYAQSRLGGRLDRHLAAEAFDQYDQAFDSMPMTGNLLDSLLYYWHTYPAPRMRGLYPRDVILDLLSDHLRLKPTLAFAANHARRAHELFTEALGNTGDPVLREFAVESEKLAGVWDAFALVLGAIAKYETARQQTTVGSAAAAAAASVRAAHRRWLEVMTSQEQVKQSYLLPQTLRDMSVAMLYFDRLAAELEALAGGSDSELPTFRDLAINQEDLDRFVSTAIDA